MPIYAFGENPFLGLDIRNGLTVNDSSPITLFQVPNLNNKILRVNIIIDATSYTSGTATYVITFTENATTETIGVSVTSANNPSGITRIIRPDASTNITVQLTGGTFTATVKVACILEDMV